MDIYSGISMLEEIFEGELSVPIWEGVAKAAVCII